MTVKKKAKSSSESSQELSELLIKQGLHMLSKATVFAAIMAKSKDLHIALLDTEKAMERLNLDAKTKKE